MRFLERAVETGTLVVNCATALLDPIIGLRKLLYEVLNMRIKREKVLCVSKIIRMLHVKD